jgi:protein phosphatase PTC2/3
MIFFSPLDTMPKQPTYLITINLSILLFPARSLIVANAGDCRAVLCRRGKAIEMSQDHKPSCSFERLRIEALGGYVCDGYLNGQLSVARALGDWHMEGLKGPCGPLSAEPEVYVTRLTEEDEFLIMGCDGLWDVFRSQNAIDFARRKLQEHNDPAICCRYEVHKFVSAPGLKSKPRFMIVS